jgi:antitoxin (DNA-binding transcriptional repressor) of toxin-antitoxin stability system
MESRVDIGELGEGIRQVLSRVLAGEVIEITDAGRAIARILPVGPHGLEKLALEGRVTESSGDLLDLLDELGLPGNARGPMLPSKALAELRDDDR